MNQNKRRSGMTLIELVAVVAIIAVLAVIAIPRFQAVTESAKVSVSESNFRMVQSAILSYSTEKNGGYPTDLADVAKYIENVKPATGSAVLTTDVEKHLSKGLNALAPKITYVPKTTTVGAVSTTTGGTFEIEITNLENTYGSNDRVGTFVPGTGTGVGATKGTYTMTYDFGQ